MPNYLIQEGNVQSPRQFITAVAQTVRETPGGTDGHCAQSSQTGRKDLKKAKKPAFGEIAC